MINLKFVPRDDDVTHLVLSGRLDTAAADQIRDEVLQAIGTPAQPTLVDLSEIEFLGSRGLGLLMTASKQVGSAGHRLVLVNPSEMVAVVLRVGRLDKMAPVAADLEGALELAIGRPVVPREEVPVTSDSAAAPPPALRQARRKLSIVNDSSELSGLHDTVAEFHTQQGVPSRAAFAVNQVIHELVANVIRYAYVDDEPHQIDIELVIEGEHIIIWIHDDGRPYDPRCGPSLDPHADNREVGELGLLMVLELVDVLMYERRGDKNHVEVRIRLDHGQEPAGSASERESSA